MSEAEAAPARYTLEEVKAAIREVLGESGRAELTRKFEGGTLVLKPADDSLQAREIPIEDLFKKVIRVRDQLRVLEQKINNHSSLSAEDKSALQGYVTRSYGSLTSFNLLFKNKDDQFRGQSGKG